MTHILYRTKIKRVCGCARGRVGVGAGVVWVFPWARLWVWAWVSFGAGVGVGVCERVGPRADACGCGHGRWCTSACVWVLARGRVCGREVPIIIIVLTKVFCFL